MIPTIIMHDHIDIYRTDSLTLTLMMIKETSLSFSKKLAIFEHYFQCVMIHIL